LRCFPFKVQVNSRSSRRQNSHPSPTLVVNLPKYLYPCHSTNRGSCV
jgi:hypothetical protein